MTLTVDGKIHTTETDLPSEQNACLQGQQNMFIFPHVILDGKNSWDVSIQSLMPRSCKLGSMESSGYLPFPGYDK